MNKKEIRAEMKREFREIIDNLVDCAVNNGLSLDKFTLNFEEGSPTIVSVRTFDDVKFFLQMPDGSFKIMETK